MRLAVVGTGIAGLTAAHLLQPLYDLAVFEAEDRVGGHTHTRAVEVPEGSFSIDTGFIVCNDRTYPNFLHLMARLGVHLQATDMSFSVRCERTGLEYDGGSLSGLFAQKRNLFRPSFWGMLRDILRFNRTAPALLDAPGPGPTLGAYLEREKFGRAFIEHYLIPMVSAIWSGRPDRMRVFPAKSLIGFFRNHGLLQVRDRPQWRTVVGGSHRYVDRLTAGYRDRIRLRTPVLGIRRTDTGVELRTATGVEPFDRVVLACHPDQALSILEDADDEERRILGAFSYQANETVLHTDTGLLPRRRAAWASWNYHLPVEPAERATVTYHMNRLQRLTCRTQFCVTLNRTEAIRPETILYRTVYHHPVFDQAAVAAQGEWDRINGPRGTYYCGAWWGHGFHEDGVVSALRVAERLGARLDFPGQGLSMS